MEKTMKTRAALYARVSTGKQAEKDLSIPDQIKQMADYCQSQKWHVQKIYKELGASARDGNRPAFKEMIADAQAKGRHPVAAHKRIPTRKLLFFNIFDP